MNELPSNAAELVANARKVTEPTTAEDARLWQRLSRGGAKRSRSRWRTRAWIGGALTAASALTCLVLVWRNRVDRNVGMLSIELGEIGRIEVSRGASYRIPRDERTGEIQPKLFLNSGEVVALILPRSSKDPFAVETPALRVTVMGTKFMVQADRDFSRVVVEDGRVLVEGKAGGTVLISTGQAIDSNDARLSSPPPANLAPPAVRENVKEVTVKRPLAAASTLGAENELYREAIAARDQGNSARALSLFRTYERTFPSGVLRVDASRAILELLMADKHLSEAVTRARLHLSRYSDDPRRAEISLALGQLERSERHDLKAALRAFQLALDSAPSRRVTDEVLFQKGTCEQALGLSSKATWQRYRAEFPQGIHVSEVEALWRSGKY